MNRNAGRPVLGSADVERALASQPLVRSEHFLLHHVMRFRPTELSTGAAPPHMDAVDDRRLGLLVPKRHARRAVTRNLIKRQGRAAFAGHCMRLRPGDWLLRLRSPFPVAAFTSAASAALRLAVRGELQALFDRAALRS